MHGVRTRLEDRTKQGIREHNSFTSHNTFIRSSDFSLWLNGFPSCYRVLDLGTKAQLERQLGRCRRIIYSWAFMHYRLSLLVYWFNRFVATHLPWAFQKAMAISTRQDAPFGSSIRCCCFSKGCSPFAKVNPWNLLRPPSIYCYAWRWPLCSSREAAISCKRYPKVL